MKSKPAETSTVILARTQTDDQLAGEITDGVVSRMTVSRTSPRRWRAATGNNIRISSSATVCACIFDDFAKRARRCFGGRCPRYALLFADEIMVIGISAGDRRVRGLTSGSPVRPRPTGPHARTPPQTTGGVPLTRLFRSARRPTLWLGTDEKIRS
jgi:hypothetical protein